MTGPEHYAEAERCLAKHADLAAVMRDHVDSGQYDVDVLAAAGDVVGQALVAAQVHATLALAAATALGLSDGGGAGMRGADAEAWERVCSVLPVDEIAPPLDDVPVCGAELHPGAGDGITCIRYIGGDQHSDGFHDDGRGNRW